MRKVNRGRFVAPLAGVICVAGLVGSAQAALYAGNGANGFGGSGAVGNGSLSVTDSGGNITFSFSASGGTLSGNDLVLYIDSTSGGYTDTSAFSDDGDGGREAVSGYNAGNGPSRTLAVFSSGFQADYAISIEDSFVGLFQLASGGNNSLNYITGNTPSSEPDTLTIPISDLGIIPGSSFNFEGSLISETAYRSNETIGASSPGGDPGFSGTTTFTAADSYTTTPVPEPFGLSALCVGGLMFVSRRRRSPLA